MDKKDSGGNWALQLVELRASFSRTQSFLLLLSTFTAYVIKVFDKKPASLQVCGNTGSGEYRPTRSHSNIVQTQK